MVLSWITWDITSRRKLKKPQKWNHFKNTDHQLLGSKIMPWLVVRPKLMPWLVVTASWFQTESQTVWFPARKSAAKIKFPSASKHCIASQKIERGDNMHSHQLQIPAKTYLLSKSFAGVRSPKRGKLVRACVHAWMKFLKSREFCFQQYIFFTFYWLKFNVDKCSCKYSVRSVHCIVIVNSSNININLNKCRCDFKEKIITKHRCINQGW